MFIKRLQRKQIIWNYTTKSNMILSNILNIKTKKQTYLLYY